MFESSFQLLSLAEILYIGIAGWVSLDTALAAMVANVFTKTIPYQDNSLATAVSTKSNHD